jgi:hypothetical protein
MQYVVAVLRAAMKYAAVLFEARVRCAMRAFAVPCKGSDLFGHVTSEADRDAIAQQQRSEYRAAQT